MFCIVCTCRCIRAHKVSLSTGTIGGHHTIYVYTSPQTISPVWWKKKRRDATRTSWKNKYKWIFFETEKAAERERRKNKRSVCFNLILSLFSTRRRRRRRFLARRRRSGPTVCRRRFAKFLDSFSLFTFLSQRSASWWVSVAERRPERNMLSSPRTVARDALRLVCKRGESESRQIRSAPTWPAHTQTRRVKVYLQNTMFMLQSEPLLALLVIVAAYDTRYDVEMGQKPTKNKKKNQQENAH